MNLKQRLLDTSMFIDNSYLDRYVELVSTHSVEKSAFKSQTHHILPRAYFKHEHIRLDDSDANVVELLYKDHVLAHWLLSKCTQGYLKKSSYYALNFLRSSLNISRYDISDEDLEYIQLEYERSFSDIPKEQFVEYYKSHSNRETSHHFSINHNAVVELAKHFDCQKNARRSKQGRVVAIDKDELYQYYIVEKHTLKETANHFDVDKSTIIRKLSCLNLSQGKHHYKHKSRSDYRRTIDDVEYFKKFYSNHTILETSLEFNMSDTCVKRYIKELKISKKPVYNLKEIYEDFDKYGITSTAKKHNLTKSHIYKLISKFKKLGGASNGNKNQS